MCASSFVSVHNFIDSPIIAIIVTYDLVVTFLAEVTILHVQLLHEEIWYSNNRPPSFDFCMIERVGA